MKEELKHAATCLMEDLDLLQSGEWVPDNDSVEASLDNAVLLANVVPTLLDDRDTLLSMVTKLDDYLRAIRSEELDGSEPELGALLEESQDLWLRCAKPDNTNETAPLPEIPRFKLTHSGENPEGYAAEASRSGDRGVYDEVRIGVFKGAETGCMADVLVGLTEQGEPRVLITADGQGDDAHRIAVYPLRTADKAVENWNE